MPTDAREAIDVPAEIQIRGVSKWFGEHKVLKSVSADVKRGEALVVIGPSGSGKTTLLRCINMLEEFQEGEIRIGGDAMGYTIDAAGRRVRRSEAEIAGMRAKLGMVFQSFNLFPHMSVLKNVALGPMRVLRMAPTEAAAHAAALIARVGLADKKDALPGQLSGGQQQRVAIARALAMKPKAMLFDEVTSALDPELVAEVLDVMRQLSAGGHDDGDRYPRDGFRAGVRAPRAVHGGRRDRRTGRARKAVPGPAVEAVAGLRSSASNRAINCEHSPHAQTQPGQRRSMSNPASDQEGARSRSGPLSGLRVIDAGTMIAGPLAATQLADFGAEVIKVELPGIGDSMRHWAPMKDGRSLWWKVIARNKRLITLSLSKPRGQELFRELVRGADIVIENYRPGTFERWGLGYSDLAKINRRLVLECASSSASGSRARTPSVAATARSRRRSRASRPSPAFPIGHPPCPASRWPIPWPRRLPPCQPCLPSITATTATAPARRST